MVINLISPRALTPFTIFDHIITLIILWLFIRKIKTNKIKFRQRKNAHFYNDRINNPINKPMNIDEAYRILGTNQQQSIEDIRKAYIEKISKNHPDKVTHLSDELQSAAAEITIKLNQAFEIIKKQKG